MPLLPGTTSSSQGTQTRLLCLILTDAVITDGGLYMATPLDPVFLLLPVLEAAAAQVICSSASEDHFF